jgi:hypothetical protein
MRNVRIAGCALALFGSLAVWASSVSAECTPVVYMFRHAEDTNPPEDPDNNQFHPPKGTVPLFVLTPTGQAHARLYPTMISGLQAANNYCAVTKVYATTTVRKDAPCDPTCDSATNAFYTGKPLADAVMSNDPITTVTVADGSRKQLYEYVGNGNAAPTALKPSLYSNPVATALRTELLKTASLGQSSAIFWTSQGMQVLGGVIIGRDSKVPGKNGWVMPPRNAAYIFAYLGPDKGAFDDTPTIAGPGRTSGREASVWVQCFNVITVTEQPNTTITHAIFTDPDPEGSFFEPQRFYCGFDDQSSIGGKPLDGCAENAKCGSVCNDGDAADCYGKSNRDIKGKICNTGLMSADSSGTGIFGSCESPQQR